MSDMVFTSKRGKQIVFDGFVKEYDEEYKNVEYGKDNPSGFAFKVVKL